MEKTIKLESIKVGKRFRRDMGDLGSLAEDMKNQGLIVPIGVTPSNVLVFGERRLRAAKKIGWKTIRASVIESLEDELKLLQAEEAENNLHKPFTPSERVAIRNAINESQKPGQNGKHAASRGKLPQLTRDDVSKKAGFSSDDEFQRARQVLTTGYRPLIKAMDEGRLTVSQAAVLTKLPKSELADVFEREDTQQAYKEVRQAKVVLSDTVLKFFSDVLGRPWGVAEQYGSVEAMFSSAIWKQRENKNRIGEYCDKVAAIAKAYADLNDQCRAYRRKHGI